MTARLRLAAASLALALLGGCAGGASSGVGLGEKLASVEPAPAIGEGPLTPQGLLGVAPQALSARLGPPSFRRTEPDAEVWQYGGAGCSLFVYFYKAGGGGLASAYVDARKTTGGAADASACLADVAAKRNAPVS
ncbi:MAG: hypothetical protein K8R18_00645 [Parvibaculum sp.]|uniref:hypothetical protein n=1 Tax=Parvibaculum sp. TaxID=2024848 RepID=UPI0025DEBDF1|nr:hypothetical protein [Parvibaculum sp.]MCE9648105.1 hypothetical protein [Parvibaculum sp.]